MPEPKAIVWSELDPDGTMSVAQRVSAALTSLRSSERHVATYLATNPFDAAAASAGALAREVEVSDATVVRTARALGYQGFTDLKAALMRDIARFRPSSEQAKIESLTGTARGLDDARVAATRLIEELHRRLDAQDLDAAVAVIEDARTVLTYGIGASATVADYLALRLGRVGVVARSVRGTGFSFADAVLQVRSGDGLVLIAPGRLHRDMEVLLDRCTELDVPVVLVSDTLGPVLASRVKVSLWAPFSPSGNLGETLTSTHMVDLVLDALIRRAPDQTAEAYGRLSEARRRLTQ
ncbi:MurR/RpiR family transcriptional regulator [Sphaerisporangium sp. NPDC051017]|uniref:MurR/RpiR family transcriptional regulator n=1 Tax=unclassified Sphaerisporangium TaxID=2630420 RepID=UPI003405ACE0